MMPAPLYCCSRGLTERKGPVVLLKGTAFTGSSTRRTVNVRKISWSLGWFNIFQNCRCWSYSEGKLHWNPRHPRHHWDTESWTIRGPGLLLQWSRHQSDEDSGWKIETWRKFSHQNIIIYQVADIGPYHGHEKKLIDDINEVKIVKNFFYRNILILNIFSV